MRFYIFLGVLLLNTIGQCQISVRNPRSGIFQDRPLVAYIGIDNPVTITTGNDSVADVTVKNGILVSAGGGGKYWLRTLPDQLNPVITITIKTAKEERKFNFEIRSIPLPEAQFGGLKNEDNMFDNFRTQAKGIFCINKNFDLPTMYKVDSFTVLVYHSRDSLSGFHHTNQGAAWDPVTSKEIWKAKEGSWVIVKKIWVIGPDGRQFILKPELKGYINQ